MYVAQIFLIKNVLGYCFVYSILIFLNVSYSLTDLIVNSET